MFFQIVGRFNLFSMHLRRLEIGVQLKTTVLLVSFPWLVKPLKNFKLIYRLFDYFKNVIVFPIFGIYGSHADLLVAVSDRTAAHTVALNIFKAYNGHGAILCKFRSYGI